MSIKFWSHLACLVVGTILGIWLGVVGTASQNPEPVRYIQTVYEPAPCHDYTSEMNELAILREAARREQEIREAKNYFAKGRDPFERKRDMGQYRLKQQEAITEQEMGR
jgi:hypothetical protein